MLWRPATAGQPFSADTHCPAIDSARPRLNRATKSARPAAGQAPQGPARHQRMDRGEGLNLQPLVYEPDGIFCPGEGLPGQAFGTPKGRMRNSATSSRGSPFSYRARASQLWLKEHADNDNSPNRTQAYVSERDFSQTVTKLCSFLHHWDIAVSRTDGSEVSSQSADDIFWPRPVVGLSGVP